MELRWLDAVGGPDGDAFATLLARFWQEVLPGERPIPVSELHAQVAYGPRHRTMLPVLVLEKGEAVGAALLAIHGLRPEMATVRFLFAAPERRRRGIGTALLQAVQERARSAGRTRLRTLAPDRQRATVAFAERAGARPGEAVEQSRCPVGALDPDRLRSWVARAAERAGGYSLVAFDGICPDEHLEAFAALVPVMNTAPPGRGTVNVAPAPDDVRSSMAAHAREGNESWTLCARDDATGRFVAYTELLLSRHRPWHALQGDTGVDPGHRRRGIARWIKAVNALRLLEERTDVEHIETWNAAGNDAMVSINRAMGFRVVARWQEWELELPTG